MSMRRFTLPRVIDTTHQKDQKVNPVSISSEIEIIEPPFGSYTLQKPPILNSQQLTLNGQVLTPGTNGDYEIENKTISLNRDDITVGDIVVVTYLSA